LVAGVTVSNHFNAKYGRDYLEAQSGAFTLHHDFGYDGYGRLNMVSNGAQAAIYSYLPGTDRLQSTAFHSSGSPVMTTTRAWQFGERLQSIANVANAAAVSSHCYLYDAIHRRTQANMEDGSVWKYDYDDRNELTAGRRYWADWSPVSGQRFEYAYDSIGNRTNAASGGDVNGANLRTTTYAVNNLNQYTTVTTPGYKDILGVALATNSVTVNSGSCDRKGEFFHREITVANSSSAVWQNVTASSAGNSTNGNLAVPKNAQSYTYDLDGNLTYDGLWFYAWDGENRLTGMSMSSIETSGFPAAQRKSLGFAYDQLGRRIRKIMGSWNGGGFTNYATNLFVYDGWNLVAELDHVGNVRRSYTWGQDLNGKTSLDEENVGGVGGLLLLREHGTGTTNHFAGFDGNGNVLALVKTDGSLSARYEYSPFGETIRASGPLARTNPFRWSSKFTDEESGLVCYGYRQYLPCLGRWISRDPLGEEGGMNLNAFVANNAICHFDLDGRSDPIELIRKLPNLTRSLMVSAMLAWKAKGGSGPSVQNWLSKQQGYEQTARELRASGKKGERKGGQGGGGKGGAAMIAIGLGLVWLEATERGISAFASVLSDSSPSQDETQASLQSMFRKALNGDDADFDIISAALEMTGGTAADALVAWDAFETMADVAGSSGPSD